MEKSDVFTKLPTQKIQSIPNLMKQIPTLASAIGQLANFLSEGL
jgi:hypothetical protein